MEYYQKPAFFAFQSRCSVVTNGTVESNSSLLWHQMAWLHSCRVQKVVWFLSFIIVASWTDVRYSWQNCTRSMEIMQQICTHVQWLSVHTIFLPFWRQKTLWIALFRHFKKLFCQNVVKCLKWEWQSLLLYGNFWKELPKNLLDSNT